MERLKILSQPKIIQEFTEEPAVQLKKKTAKPPMPNVKKVKKSKKRQEANSSND